MMLGNLRGVVLAGAGSLLTLVAASSGATTAVAPPKAPATLCANSKCATTAALGAVKFHPGHYVWFDNVFWTKRGNTEQNSFNSFMASYGSDTTIAGVEIYLTWSQIEGAQGDYSAGKAIIDGIISTLRAQNHPMRLLLQLSLASPATAATDGNYWPSYASSAGYVVNKTSGYTGSQVDLTNPTAVAAYSAMLKYLGSLYDSEPLLEMISPGDETDAGPPMNSAAYVSGLQTLYGNTVTAFPHTLVRINGNFLPYNEDTGFANLFSWARATYPGHFSVGGPDPDPAMGYALDGHLVFRNTCGPTNGQYACNTANFVSPKGDLRGIMPFVGHVEENGLVTLEQSGHQASPVTGGPSALLNYWLNTAHAWHVVWNVENYGYWGWTSGSGTGANTNTELAAIHGANGKTLSGTPSEGVWNTN